MGLGGIGVWPLLLILVIVLLLFGTKKLRNMGGDVGSAIRGFKQAMNEGESEKTDEKKDGDSAAEGSPSIGQHEQDSTSKPEQKSEHDRHAS